MKKIRNYGKIYDYKNYMLFDVELLDSYWDEVMSYYELNHSDFSRCVCYECFLLENNSTLEKYIISSYHIDFMYDFLDIDLEKVVQCNNLFTIKV